MPATENNLFAHSFGKIWNVNGTKFCMEEADSLFGGAGKSLARFARSRRLGWCSLWSWSESHRVILDFLHRCLPFTYIRRARKRERKGNFCDKTVKFCCWMCFFRNCFAFGLEKDSCSNLFCRRQRTGIEFIWDLTERSSLLTKKFSKGNKATFSFITWEGKEYWFAPAQGEARILLFGLFAGLGELWSRLLRNPVCLQKMQK